MAAIIGLSESKEMPPGHVLSDLARDNLVGVAAHPVSSTNLEWLVARVQH
jgi:hypothetical protein